MMGTAPMQLQTNNSMGHAFPTCYLQGRHDESMMRVEVPCLGDHSETGRSFFDDDEQEHASIPGRMRSQR
jgi:hypothetical protein